MTDTPGASSRRATGLGYEVLQAIAPARTREAQPDVDAAPVRGAVEHALVPTRAALPRSGSCAARRPGGRPVRLRDLRHAGPASDGLPEPLAPFEAACSTHLVDTPNH